MVVSVTFFKLFGAKKNKADRYETSLPFIWVR